MRKVNKPENRGVRIQSVITPTLHKHLVREAKKEKATVSTMINLILRAYLT